MPKGSQESMIVVPLKPASQVHSYSGARIEEWLTDAGAHLYFYIELHITPNYIRDWANRSPTYPDFIFSSARILR